jgi:hypothetical protein
MTGPRSRLNAAAMLPWAAMALLLLIHHLIHRVFFPGT